MLAGQVEQKTGPAEKEVDSATAARRAEKAASQLLREEQRTKDHAASKKDKKARQKQRKQVCPVLKAESLYILIWHC